MDRVWDAISHAESWPSWWPGLLRVEEVAPGGADRIGRIQRFIWKGQLPYTLRVDMRVTRMEPPSFLESAASGELEGMGCWRLAAAAGGTEVSYEWRVRTTRLWMNVIGSFARPLFAWNHDLLMRRGERGLKRLLER